MALYPTRAVERAMKVQEVILRAMSKQISWIEAAEIIGVSPRTMRRWRRRYERCFFLVAFGWLIRKPPSE